MQNVCIVDARRTPFGSFGGNLTSIPAYNLVASVIQQLLVLIILPAEAIDEVSIGKSCKVDAKRLQLLKQCDQLAPDSS